MSQEGRRTPPLRVTFVADEVLGFVRDGLGTTTTFLAVAIARMGHRVQVLYLGPEPITPVDPEWQQLYDAQGIDVIPVPRGAETIEPALFARMREAELALRSDPPDVVIVQDLGAPAYSAMRLRHLGLGFEQTAFVVLCHGTRQWITDVGRKVRVLPGALAVTVLERASVELADTVVSPSAYMVEWMRAQGWRLPEQTFVVPHVTRSGATGKAPPEPDHVDSDGRVERVAFFGRLEERKGVRPLLAALNRIEPELLSTIQLAFVGRPTAAWSPDRVLAFLSERTKPALRRISFETDLDQHEALAFLSRPGTLAVMPSFAEAFGNTVRECLERGIPFIASNAAAIRELIAPEDHDRVLFEPTPDGIEQALRRALSDSDALRPARPAFDDAVALRGWQEVLALRPRVVQSLRERPPVDVVVVHRRSQEALARCLSGLRSQGYADFTVTVVLAGANVPSPDGLGGKPLVVRSERTSVDAARAEGLQAGSAPWVVFLDEEDVPEEALLETLLRAQAGSGADVVSCGLFLEDGEATPLLHFFPGQPRALGLLSNGYGNVALLRRSRLGEPGTPWPVEGDPDWSLLAGLSADGAHIVSVPAPLVTRRVRPGTIDRHPSDALLVIEHLERALPEQLASAVRLAAGLAADAHGQTPGRPGGLARRALGRLVKSFR